MAGSSSIEETRTLGAAVLRDLREDILNCRLRPGEKLRFSDLKKRYGVGLSPLREALHHLSAEGLVDAHAQRGFTVAVMTLDDLNDLVRMRLEIEPLALADALTSGGDTWEAEIVRSVHHLRLLGPVSTQVDANTTTDWRHRHKTFHMALLAGCTSPRLLNLCDSLFDQSERYRLWLIVSGRVARDVEAEHDALAQAAIARDVNTATALLKAHVQGTANAVARMTKETEGSEAAA